MYGIGKDRSIETVMYMTLGLVNMTDFKEREELTKLWSGGLFCSQIEHQPIQERKYIPHFGRNNCLASVKQWALNDKFKKNVLNENIVGRSRSRYVGQNTLSGDLYYWGAKLPGWCRNNKTELEIIKEEDMLVNPIANNVNREGCRGGALSARL